MRERGDFTLGVSPDKRLLQPLIVVESAETFEFRAVVFPFGVGVLRNALHPKVFLLLIGQAINPVGCIQVVGASEIRINYLVGVAYTVVVAAIREVIATHVGKLLGLEIHGYVFLSHEVVEGEIGFLEEPMLVAALAYGAHIHYFLVFLDDVVFFVVEECSSIFSS